MFWPTAVIMIILGLVGLVSGFTLGGVTHLLLVLGITLVGLRIIQGRVPA
jgi:hypothetical protein